jgi:hypothetical protein
MINPKSESSDKNRSPQTAHFSGARKIGYIVSILVFIVFLYVVRHLRQWGLDFLTENFDKCLFYIQLSIYVSIAAQVLFIVYDNRWFKHLIQGIVNITSALSLIMIYVIFPFNIQDGDWIKWIKIGIIILFILTVLSIFVELIKGFRYLAKNPEAI